MSVPQAGDVICDPMCGGSSIPIEVKIDLVNIATTRCKEGRFQSVE